MNSSINLALPQIQTKEVDIEYEEAPFCMFSLSMDKVRYSSFKFKIWEDQHYLAEMTKRHHRPHTHL